jgi:hypothetical protein
MLESRSRRTADLIPRILPRRARATAATRRNRSLEGFDKEAACRHLYGRAYRVRAYHHPGPPPTPARSELVPLRELYLADTAAPANENEEDVAPSPPAAPTGPVRIDRKRQPEPKPALKLVLEPVRHISVGQSS